MKLDQIVAIITGIGQVTGAGTIAADERLNFNLRIVPDAALAASGDAAASNALALGLQGALGKSSRDGIGLKIAGTADNPKFTLETRALAGAVLSGLLAGKTGDPAAEATLDKEALQEKTTNAVLQGLFGKKKKDEPPAQSSDDGN